MITCQVCGKQALVKTPNNWLAGQYINFTNEVGVSRVLEEDMAPYGWFCSDECHQKYNDEHYSQPYPQPKI